MTLRTEPDCAASAAVGASIRRRGELLRGGDAGISSLIFAPSAPSIWLI
jgi:hypothetical protein